MTSKTRGQLAYETDCTTKPTYHDGTTRKPWHALDSVAQWSWERELDQARIDAELQLRAMLRG